MRTITTGLLAFGLACGSAQAAFVSENFDDITTLGASGWLQVNNSTPGGTTGWFQGNPGVFPAAGGPAESYIAANFENAPLGGAISNWLITPQVDFSSIYANSLTFSLRGNPSGFFPDAIEVYYSITGTSVGADPFSTGDFSLIQRYDFLTDPGAWLSFDLTIGAQASAGYYAFRYVVGDTTLAGDYIGIDSVSAAVKVPEPSTMGLFALALAGLALAWRRRRST